MLLNPNTAKKTISCGLELGADFVDLFVEKVHQHSFSYTDQKVKRIQSGIDFGIGIRAIFGTKVLYGYTNQDNPDELLRIIQELCALDKRDPRTNLGQMSAPQYSNYASSRLGLAQQTFLEEKIRLAKEIDTSARSLSHIAQVSVSVIQKNQQVEIFDSLGLHVQDNRPYIRITGVAVANDGPQNASSFYGPGALQGWEFAEKINGQSFGEYIAQGALTSLRAKPCPAGKMPVIIDKGFGGVIFHEACGHLLETTSVEKKASAFHDKMGEKIAHSAVSAVDDGTIAHSFGSINMDDEGMPTQKTQLIKDGQLVGFLSDRVGELKTGHPRTGSARRQSYHYPPASRMRNTFIEPGDYDLEELIRSVDYGLYAKKMGGGSVSPGTGEFNFSVEEGHLIEKGKITTAVKGATLIGSGPNVLPKISMVGKDLELNCGMCGSVSGSVPVTVGQPPLKVDEILVGGQS